MLEPAIEIQDLCTVIEGQKIHQNLNLIVQNGEIMALVGESGSGKTTLLNSLLMLTSVQKGIIKIFGQNIQTLSQLEREELRAECGMLFQGGALFGALTVLENVRFPMQEHSQLSITLLTKLAQLKIAMVGLPKEAENKYPDELSGGMIKRAAMARSMALDPTLLFLDEPSAGLDPINADSLDHLILELKSSLQLTMLIVTHDLDTLQTVADRIAFLGQGKVLACDT